MAVRSPTGQPVVLSQTRQKITGTRVRKQPKKPTKKVAAKKPKLGPLYDPAVALSGKQLKAAATGATNAVIRPQVDALKQQLAGATTQGTALANNAKGYYEQLAAKEAGNVARQQAIGQLAAGQVQAGGATTDAALKGVVADVNAGQAADRALRGGGLEGGNSAQPGTEVVAAGDRNAAYRTAAEGQIAAGTQDWAGLQDAMRSARESRGGEISGQLLNRLANQQTDIRGKISTVRASRGDTQMNNLLKLRQQGFDNAATQKALGVKLDSIAQQAATAAASRRAAAKRARLSASTTKRGQNLSHADRVAARKTAAAKTAQKTGAAAKKTRAAGLKAFQPVLQTIALINTHFTAPDPNDPNKTHPANTEQTRAALLNKGTPSWAIDAAISIRHHGYILPSVAKTFPPGVVIPKRYRPNGRHVAPVRRPTPPKLAGTVLGPATRVG